MKTKCSLKSLTKYFFRLGYLGFGGPAALVQYMERDLVEEKKWITEEEYAEGIALAQLAPGPLAAQLAIYLGWVRFKNVGATVCGLAFVAPSFFICVILAVLYTRFSSLPWLQPVFYVVGASVIGIIVMSSYKLAKKTIGKDKFLLAIWIISALTTAITETENLYVIIGSGVIYMIWKSSWRPGKLSVLPLLMGINGPASDQTLKDILLYFTKAGAFVFGSGLAIVPFLHSGVVGDFRWLTERQFLDAVAVAMITPGPVIITVAFIGFLVAGAAGAFIAAVGTFFPCYVFTVLPAPFFNKYAKNPYLKTLILGITSAAVGAIGGACWVLGKRAIIDPFTAGVTIITLVFLMRTKVKEPVLILFAGLLGLTLYALK